MYKRERNELYINILIEPVIKCADYKSKFGHKDKKGFTVGEFKTLYRSDPFYKWLGLDNPLMYYAHRAAGGITSLYRQIGIGSERLVRQIFMDYLKLNKDDVRWSYKIKGANGKDRILSLDARIVIDKISDMEAKERCVKWIKNAMTELYIGNNSFKGIIFEVRQGYKSKDSKRQNADSSNAASAYANGYMPCLMVMSSQIDADIAVYYKRSLWFILQGCANNSPLLSTFTFFKKIIGFDFAEFMNSNQEYFSEKVKFVLEQLIGDK